MQVGDVVRVIRQRSGKTMVEFAQMLGVTQGTISRYEAGKQYVTRQKLMILYTLAETPEEKKALRAALRVAGGLKEEPTDQEVRDGIEQMQRSLDRIFAEKVLTRDDERVLRLAELFQEILQGSPPSEAILAILDLWAKHGQISADIRRRFDNAASYLEVQLSGALDQDALEPDERRADAPKYIPPSIRAERLAPELPETLQNIQPEELDAVGHLVYFLRNGSPEIVDLFLKDLRRQAANAKNTAKIRDKENQSRKRMKAS